MMRNMTRPHDRAEAGLGLGKPRKATLACLPRCWHLHSARSFLPQNSLVHSLDSAPGHWCKSKHILVICIVVEQLLMESS